MRKILQDLMREKKNRILSGQDVFGFDIGQPVGEVHPDARDRLKQVAADSHAFGYQPGFGNETLRETFCSRLEFKYQLAQPIGLANVLVTKGSKPVYPSWARIMLKPGDKAIVPSIGYAIHYDSVKKAGGSPITYPCGPGIDVMSAIETAVEENPDAKYILVNTPHNPTCITVNQHFFQKLVSLIKSKGMKLIVDLAYEDLILSGAPSYSVFEIEGALELDIVETHSMTKGHNISGVGFVVGRIDLLEQLSTDMTDDGYGVFLPLQYAAEVALKDEEAVLRNCELYRGNDDILTSGLNSFGWTAHRTKATFYKWLEVPEGFTSEQLCHDLLTYANVSIWPASGFLNGSTDHVIGERERVRFSMVETPERTMRAIDSMAKFFKKRPDRKRA